VNAENAVVLFHILSFCSRHINSASGRIGNWWSITVLRVAHDRLFRTFMQFRITLWEKGSGFMKSQIPWSTTDDGFCPNGRQNKPNKNANRNWMYAVSVSAHGSTSCPFMDEVGRSLCYHKNDVIWKPIFSAELLEPDVGPSRGLIPNYTVKKLGAKVPIVHQGKSNFTVGDRECAPFLWFLLCCERDLKAITQWIGVMWAVREER
jgi:hypothetical protein